MNTHSFRATVLTDESGNMRAIGYALLILSLLALIWDMTHLLMGVGVVHFAGILDIWTAVDRTSFILIQTALLKTSSLVWVDVLQPILTAPAALLLGIPGCYIVMKTQPEIEMRAPSMAEMELMRQGVDGREIRRLKRSRRIA